MPMKRYAVIMAGGAGERFWPLSRISKPKHLWNVTGDKKCLLSQTFARVSKIVPRKNVIVISGAEQLEAARQACPEIPPEQMIAEPCGRDTTAAIGLAAILVERAAGGAESSFAVFPSDHIVEGERDFKSTLLQAFEVAEGGDRLVTIGIKPLFPATGYGYVRRGEKIETSFGDAYFARKFCEKPDAKRAARYLKSGDFYWNAGMFVWRTDSILKAIERNVPQTFAILRGVRGKLDRGASLDSVLKRAYPKIEKISIDFSVMEKARNACVVPARFKWDDVGSWSAVERHRKRDERGNAAVGRVFSEDASDCIVFDAAGRATALLGVKDLIVVHAGDATLVCHRSCAEKLKQLVRKLPNEYR